MTTKNLSQTSKSRPSGSRIATILVSVFGYCVYCLIIYGSDTNTNTNNNDSLVNVSDIGNILALIGLFMFCIGILFETIAALCSNHPKIEAWCQTWGAIILILGGIFYLVSIQRVLRDVAGNCINNGMSINDNNGDDDELACYYGAYFTSVLELIAVRAIIIGIFILCSLWNLNMHVFIFATDVGVVGGFMAFFLVEWHKDYVNKNGHNSNIDNMFKAMFVGCVSFYFIAIGATIVIGLIKCHVLQKSMKYAYIGAAWIMASAICIFGGSIYGTLNGNVFSDTADYGIIFSIVPVCFALFLACIKYAILGIMAAYQAINNNDDDEVDNDFDDNGIDVSIIDHPNSSINGNYLKLSAVV